MLSRRSRRLGRPSATLAALLFCAAGAATGCDDSSYEDAPGSNSWGGPGRMRQPGPCAPIATFVLRTTRELLTRDGGPNPSGLSVRLCIDSRCEDRPLEAGRPAYENGVPVLAFDLVTEGLDSLRAAPLAAVSLYSPGQRAPLFTDVREFSLASAGACQGGDCATFSCMPLVATFDVPDGVAPAAPCGAGAGGELVVAVRAEEALVLASPTLFAEVCVDSACREALASVAEGLPAGGDLVTIVVPLGAEALAGGEHVVKLALGYESGAPLYTDARLMSFDPGALCGREGDADVVFSISADALPTRPTPRPIPDAGTTAP